MKTVKLNHFEHNVIEDKKSQILKFYAAIILINRHMKYGIWPEFTRYNKAKKLQIKRDNAQRFIYLTSRAFSRKFAEPVDDHLEKAQKV